MNFGDPTDQAIEWLIVAAIHTSRLYVWLRIKTSDFCHLRLRKIPLLLDFRKYR